jgi:hypothetical protein
MIRGALLFIILLLIPFYTFSQEKDFGVWLSLNAEYGITKKLELDASVETRTFNRASEIEQTFIEAGLTYKLTKVLSFSGAYRLAKSIENDDDYYLRHKWFVDSRVKLEPGRFTLRGRLRFQEQRRTYFKNEEYILPRYQVRLKLTTMYRTPSFPVNPYMEFETFMPVFSDKSRVIGKNRFTAGIEYKFNKTHAVELEYLFERDYLPKIADMNIIGLGYNLKF